MRRPKRRSLGRIKAVEATSAGAAPVQNGGGDLAGAAVGLSESEEEAVEVLRGGAVDVELPGFGEDFDPDGAAGEGVEHERGAFRDEGLLGVEGGPEEFDHAAL